MLYYISSHVATEIKWKISGLDQSVMHLWCAQIFKPGIYLMYIGKINKNLKFKMGVGIAIKCKETSSKLAI